MSSEDRLSFGGSQNMRLIGVVLLLANLGLADTITFRDGRSVNGSYLGGDSRVVRVVVNDHVENYQVDEISSISLAARLPVEVRPGFRTFSPSNRLLC